MRSSNTPKANVVQLFPGRAAASPFTALTQSLILRQFRNGTLDEAVMVALLAASGIAPGGDHE